MRMVEKNTKSLHLLLIDDDKIDRINTIRALKQSDLTVTICEASTADEGLKLARTICFDLILLDYMLPSTTGIAVLRQLRNSETKNTAVVMLSHNDDFELATKCIEAGAQDFITKKEITASRLCRATMHSQERFRIENELRESHERLRQLSELDSLTGLANRYFFDTTLKNALALANRHHHKMALVFLDLDKFKDINDTLGHDAGDKLLQEVSLRLSHTVRDEDILCRLGGDEFAILVQNLQHVTTISKLTDRILTALSAPYLLSGQQLIVSASIGVSNYPDCGTDGSQLMKCADVAMYRAKEAGRNQAHFYSKELHQLVQTRVELERDLRHVIERNELIVYYQPQVDSINQALVGVEALVRWQHPVRGLVSPLDFIPLAEEIGMIEEIGLWVFKTTCEQLSAWRKQYDPQQLTLSIAINLSASQLNNSDLLNDFKKIIVANNIPASNIELELTETVLNQTVTAQNLLEQLAALGITLAIDDFGTGYSSLSQLQKYPFKVIKIDKTFIHTIIDDSSDIKFFKAIHSFAKTMGFKVVAEGIETELQSSVCRQLGIERLQGFYFSKPVPAHVFEDLWLKH